jgi:acetolactate synthase-1/2/3 large subunit
MIAAAQFPLIVCQRGDPQGRLGAALERLVHEQVIAVCDFWAIRSVLATDHPMHAGFDVGPLLERADLVIAVDSPVPWIPKIQAPAAGAKVIHIGADPLFARTPVRGYPADLHITADPAAALTAIADELGERFIDVEARYDEIVRSGEARHARMRETALKGGGTPMTPAYVTHCVAQVMDDDAVMFNELGAAAPFHTARGPNRFFTPPFSGGLGWGLPAAMGAALADRDRLALAAVGDGSYIFANPVACHQIAEAHGLPVLTIVMNNGIWNAVRRATLAMYPDGAAAQMNRMPVTSLEPTPDFTMIAAASRGWAERVRSGDELPAALARAVDVVRNEKRQALLEVSVSV